MKTITGAVLVALLASTSVSVAMADDIAIVNKVGGKNVTWHHGDASSAASVQTLLGAGDKVAAGKGSYAEVKFIADNCTVRVSAGSSLAIGNVSPCAAEAQLKADATKNDGAKVIPAAVQTVAVMETKGPVTRVNKGEGMADASVGDTLKTGDAVFAGKGSSVSLYFASAKCSYTVAPSTAYTIADVAPCQASAANVVPTADVPSDPNVAPAVGLIPPALLIGAGAVAVGGAVAIIVTTSDNNNNSGGSPFTPD